MRMREKMMRRTLSSWRELNARIASLREEELEECVRREEARRRPRSTVLRRLKERLRAVKTAKIREEVG